MSVVGSSVTDTAAAYRALADRIEDAEVPEVWTAFGEDMEQRAREGREDHPVAGFVLNVSIPLIGEGYPLDRILHAGYRQFGGSRVGLEANAVARDAEVYAVRKTDAANPAAVSRRAVVEALRSAAEDA